MASLVAALRHFGFPGLLIIVDEVESIMNLPSARRDESYQTLRLLLDGSNVARHEIVVASTTPSMYSDPEKGLPSYPALWSRLHVDGNSKTVDYAATIIDLARTPLTQEDYEHIARAISSIFAIAKGIADPWVVLNSKVSSLADLAASGRLSLTFSATRVFVKLITDLLNAYAENENVPPEFDDAGRAFASADDALSG
jgi:hypothetical protein